jgi:hypothetical protein
MCGGGGGTTVSTTEVEPWEAQREYLERGFSDARSLYGRGAPSYYSGPTVASFDPTETAAQRSTIGYVTGPRATAQQAAAENALIGSLGGQTGFSPTQTADLLAGNVRTGAGTPYTAMEDALTTGVIDNLTGNILPQIREAQVRYQPGGGTRTDLEANRAITNAVQAGLIKPLAEMYGGAYQQAQGMRMPAAQMGIQQRQFGQQAYPTIMSAPINMYDAMGAVGEQRRAMSQRGIDQDMARYQYESNAAQNALRNYMAMVTGDYGSTTTATTPRPRDNTVANLVGTLGSAAIMASDIHIKENIVPEGVKWKGLNVYTYNYIGDDRPRRGVMAQQVEGMYPNAVTAIDGVKHVNYGAI